MLIWTWVRFILDALFILLYGAAFVLMAATALRYMRSQGRKAMPDLWRVRNAQNIIVALMVVRDAVGNGLVLYYFAGGQPIQEVHPAVLVFQVLGTVLIGALVIVKFIEIRIHPAGFRGI